MGTTEKFDCMIGKVLKEITGKEGDSKMVMTSVDGTVFEFFHWFNCCERIEINDICGDLDDLLGSPILVAEKVSSGGGIEDLRNSEFGIKVDEDDATYTWTFYKFSTIKGSVTVRWLGLSNGCYSEEVFFDVE
jgi:hypothetical protein